MAAEECRHWERYAGTTLRGKTLAVVSLGDGGQAVARRARCLGMHVIGTKRTVDGIEPTPLGVERLYPWIDLEPMLAQADIVVLYLPHTSETEGLIGKAELATMKRGAVLINVARGAVWDEQAVIRALESGHLGGAALDVAMVEPLPASSPLWDMDNVLIFTHSGSNVDSENRELTRLFCENLRLYLAEEPLKNVLDGRLLY